jgi:hypothetical protein
VAEYLWQLVIDRRVVFPDGTIVTPEPDAWLDIVWRVLTQVDGLPVQSMDVTSAGEKLASNVLEIKPIDYRTAITNLAPRSVGDSAAPSESESSFDGEKMG